MQPDVFLSVPFKGANQHANRIAASLPPSAGGFLAVFRWPNVGDAPVTTDAIQGVLSEPSGAELRADRPDGQSATAGIGDVDGEPEADTHPSVAGVRTDAPDGSEDIGTAPSLAAEHEEPDRHEPDRLETDWRETSGSDPERHGDDPEDNGVARKTRVSARDYVAELVWSQATAMAGAEHTPAERRSASEATMKELAQSAIWPETSVARDMSPKAAPPRPDGGWPLTGVKAAASGPALGMDDKALMGVRADGPVPSTSVADGPAPARPTMDPFVPLSSPTPDAAQANANPVPAPVIGNVEGPGVGLIHPRDVSKAMPHPDGIGSERLSVGQPPVIPLSSREFAALAPTAVAASADATPGPKPDAPTQAESRNAPIPASSAAGVASPPILARTPVTPFDPREIGQANTATEPHPARALAGVEILSRDSLAVSKPDHAPAGIGLPTERTGDSGVTRAAPSVPAARPVVEVSSAAFLPDITDTGMVAPPADSFPSGAREPLAVPQLSPGNATPPTVLARDIAHQMTANIPAGPGDVTELTLNPEELGRVRMRLSGSDGQISLQIISERPETQDLMRRHIEIVERAFRDLGYRDIAFDFGSSGQQDNMRNAKTVKEPDEPLRTAAAPMENPPTHSRLLTPGSLDIRL